MYAIMATRYERLGVRALLPLEGVWTGSRSAAAPGSVRAWGGFHHPAQGYRHIQMDAAITVYGDLTGRAPVSPESAALDLVRSYAHDCLHYATFRRYRLTDRGEIARVQYGINLRQPDGRTYSAPDELDDGPTRNLGILMEGATDAEATAIARQTAESCGITSMCPEPRAPGLALADATGTLTADGIEAALASADPYARSLGRFGRTVTARYQALLAKLDGDHGEAHGQFIAGMISGDLAELETWLDPRHGPGAFARLFRARPLTRCRNWSGDAAPGGHAAHTGPVGPVTSSPETRSRTAGRAWVSSRARSDIGGVVRDAQPHNTHSLWKSVPKRPSLACRLRNRPAPQSAGRRPWRLRWLVRMAG